jgi:ribosomal protein S1
MVIRLDRQACRIGLSMKRLLPNPWRDLADRLQPGQVIEVNVSRIGGEGVYACIDGGLEGLLRGDDSDVVLSPGMHIAAKVLLVDPEHERLELEPTETLTPAQEAG